MNKTKIEWTDYTINPVKGLCPVGCEYCYARAMYKRFKWNPEIRLERNLFYQFYELKLKKPSRVFVGSTIELFGDWIRPEWLHSIISYCRAYPEHTFQFLTKYPENLSRWNPWPDNAWVGATATNPEQYCRAIAGLAAAKAKVKFVSFEPLLEQMSIKPPYDLEGIDWIILGGQTGRKKFYPPEEWIRGIESAADNVGNPVFEKSNLRKTGARRQEFPQRNEVSKEV